MPRGSLARWIYHGGNKTTLDCQTRRKIITNVAKSPYYLDDDCRQKIAHLDIKLQNILLDDNFDAKVADFGLSKLIDRQGQESCGDYNEKQSSAMQGGIENTYKRLRC